MHLTDAGAHGKLFTKNDKYPEEEAKLIAELEKCAEKKIKIFGYVIDDKCQNSFNECSKIYRSKGGSFEVLKFQAIPLPKDIPSNPITPCFGGMMGMGMNMNRNMGMMNNMGMGMKNNMMNNNMGMMNNNMGMMNNNMGMMNMNMNMMNNNMNMMNNMAMSAPMMNHHQMNINQNFQQNAINSIQSILDFPK